MARQPRNLRDDMELVRDSALRQYGRNNYRWIVGWMIFRRIAPYLAVAAFVAVTFFVARKAWRLIVAANGSDFSASGSGLADTVWPWVAIGIFATAAAAFFMASWWSLERRNRSLLFVIALALVGFCVLIATWMRS